MPAHCPDEHEEGPVSTDSDGARFRPSSYAGRWEVYDERNARRGWVVRRPDGWQAVARANGLPPTTAGPPQRTRKAAAEQLLARTTSAPALESGS